MKTLKTILLSAALLAVATPALATQQLTPSIKLDTELKVQGAGVHNGDLSAAGGNNDSVGALAAKFRLLADITDKTQFFWEGRAVGSVGHGGYQSDDTGTITQNESFLEWRQSYFQFNELGGVAPLNLKLGRQRITESYGVWWNKDFDSARLTYDTTEFKGFVGGGQDLMSYRTGPDDFNEDQQDIARILAEGSWQYHYEQFFEARALYQDDHSGPRIGDVEPIGDPDRRDGQLVWAGVRAKGQSSFMGTEKNKTAYRLDLMGVAGNESSAIRSAPAGGTTTITGFRDRDVRGWAFDGSVDVPVPNMTPVIHFGYAYASGDNGTTGKDNSFRQNGLNGNFSSFGALSRSTDNYGTVLRPDLSNIHIVSAGFTMPVGKASDMGAIYRYYRLAEASTSLPSSGINTALTGTSEQLGQGLDLLFNMNLSDEVGGMVNGVQDAGLRSSVGFFRSGNAYGAQDDETAVRGLIEFKITM